MGWIIGLLVVIAAILCGVAVLLAEIIRRVGVLADIVMDWRSPPMLDEGSRSALENLDQFLEDVNEGRITNLRRLPKELWPD